MGYNQKYFLTLYLDFNWEFPFICFITHAISEDVATPLFAMARLSGWCAHRIEELVSAPKLMRPAYESVHKFMEYVPIDER